MDVVRRIDAEGLTHSLAYVVMPDHIHWLVELRAFSLDYIMQRFKSSSALRINRMSGRSGRFWQSSYHDHAIRSDESLFRHAMYVLGNPIRAGLTRSLVNIPMRGVDGKLKGGSSQLNIWDWRNSADQRSAPTAEVFQQEL